MMPPPGFPPPNFNMPPPGFPPTSGGMGPQMGQGGLAGLDPNQELWVETKTAEGKVVMQCYLAFCITCYIPMLFGQSILSIKLLRH